MKRINNLIKFVIVFFVIGITSCQKENITNGQHFNLDDYTGRYVFDIKMETNRDGNLATEYFNSVGYITKKNDYIIKIIFDYAAPKVNCVYEYAVKPDGTFVSLFKGAGERSGKFIDNTTEFSEKVDLGNGNFKNLEFFGSHKGF